MSDNKYITASCIINNHVVFKNAEKVFENKNTSLADFMLSVYQFLEIKYPKFYKMDNLGKIGWLASEILLKEISLADKYAAETIGVVLTNASASLDADIKYYESTKSIASPALFVYTLPNIVIGEICIRQQFKGENAFFISEKFDEGFMHEYVSNLINNNILQACVCGWVELLNDQYKVVLFLVEKQSTAGAMLFTKENINKIYQLQNG